MGAGRPSGSGGPNKSAAIRQYLEKNPKASTNDVINALRSDSIEVSQALIAGVRSKGILTDEGWRWEKGAKSEKSIKSIDNKITEDDKKSMLEFIQEFSSHSEMDPPEIIEYISDEVEKVGSISKFKKIYDLIKPLISGDEEEEEEEEEAVMASVSSDDDENYEDDEEEEDEDED